MAERNTGSRTKRTDTSPKAREAQTNAGRKISLVLERTGHSSAQSIHSQSELGKTHSAMAQSSGLQLPRNCVLTHTEYTHIHKNTIFKEKGEKYFTGYNLSR